MDTPPDTPNDDIVARNLAERVFSAYAQQAVGPLHPQQEQALLARLAEALRRQIGEPGPDLVQAANAALDAWEQSQHDIRGPRVASVDTRAHTVTLDPAR